MNHSSNFSLSSPQFIPFDSKVRIYGETLLKLALKGSIILPGETRRLVNAVLRDLMGASPGRYGTRSWIERRIPVCRCTRSLTRVYLAYLASLTSRSRGQSSMLGAPSCFMYRITSRLASPPLPHAQNSLSLSFSPREENRAEPILSKKFLFDELSNEINLSSRFFDHSYFAKQFVRF